MIKFFRKIRQRLISENRFSKYLIYAIGEIILVVIGIMIAVQLNNKNQDWVQQKEIEAILIKIQKEIVADLNYSNNRILRYVERDSLKNRILNGQISYNQLKTRETDLLKYSQTYFLFSMQTAGYDQLMEHLDDLPEAYDDLLKKLNRQYRSGTISRTRAKLDIYNVVKDYEQYLLEHQYWYGPDKHADTVSDAQINFFLNDPYFLNYIGRLNQAHCTSISHLVRWRYWAIDIYHEINDLLGENSQSIPDIARSTSLSTVSEANKYAGTYVLTKGPELSRLGSKIIVESTENNLYIQLPDDGKPRQLIVMHESKPWFVRAGRPFVFRFEHHGSNTISLVSGLYDQTEWERMED